MALHLEREDEPWSPKLLRVRTHSPFLIDVGEHDDAAGLLLPHHPPEVVDRVRQRSLSRDVQRLLLVALKEEKGEGSRG